MHEMSLCEAVIESIVEQTRHESFERVNTVRLEIGELAAVENEAMLFSFDAVARGTLVEGARLEIINIPGRASCSSCSSIVSVSNRYDACPECGYYPLNIISGEEMRIKELEVQ